MLLAMLVFLAITALAASSLVTMESTRTQRIREAQLLFAGDQIRRGLVSYYNTIPPGGARSLPPSLEALLEDNRFSYPVRHLRQIYPDPMTGKADWELVRSAGGITGVKSRSTKTPIKQASFPAGYEHMGASQAYSDWIFSIELPRDRTMDPPVSR